MATRFLGVRGRQQRLPLPRNTGSNIRGMPVERLSLSFDAELAQAVRRDAEAAGVPISTWLAEAAERQLRRNGWKALFAEWQAEHGAITDEERIQAAERLGMQPILGDEW
jgi:hypothetical protein